MLYTIRTVHKSLFREPRRVNVFLFINVDGSSTSLVLLKTNIMKCSNKNCSNDAMSGKDPIEISVGQVACCEYCKEQTDLQNVYEEEHDYFDRCKGLDLEFETKRIDDKQLVMVVSETTMKEFHEVCVREATNVTLNIPTEIKYITKQEIDDYVDILFVDKENVDNI